MENTLNHKLLSRIILRKLFLLIVILAQLFICNVYAQSVNNITIQQRNISVKDVLKMIEKSNQVVFFYADVDVDLNRKVSLDIKNQSIREVLDELFANTSNAYKIDGKQVYITKKPKPVGSESKQGSNKKKVTGLIVDDSHQPIIGASVLVIGANAGTVTDINGRFSIELAENSKLRISYVGFENTVIEVKDKLNYVVTLKEAQKSLDEIIVVGYSSQKKQSVVGAIVQTKGSDLLSTGAMTSVGQALTGLLPGVSTATVSGMPGAEDPKITIRGLSSWNGSDPLVLIDGVERKMSDIDVGQIESISVLKDASATAVFGVKGAEGVILITTKRGKEGKAQISFSSNTSVKYVSRVSQKMDSYDTFRYQNEVLERQNPANPANWSWYMPMDVMNKYRYPANDEEIYLYPNVDWAKEVTKSSAMTQRYDINIAGGTTFAKYFAALSYLKDEDILNSGQDVGLPYKPEYGFKHYNFRSNLDFSLTKSTTLSVNLAGSIRQRSQYTQGSGQIWSAFYTLSPAGFPVRYPDGVFGYNDNRPNDPNPIKILSGSSGLSKDYTTQIFTDFKVKQDLSFITKGLSTEVALSYDNRMYSSTTISGITLLAKSIDRDGVTVYFPPNGGNDLDYFKFPGSIGSETFNVGATGRLLHYQGQLNYARTFGKHEFGGLALMSREQSTNGSEFPHYREDWVGRLTYGYDFKYLFEANAAYNGSEKFAAKYRFGFFPSVGLGWMLSNESFLKRRWIDKLKLRYSVGTVGSDNFASPRWAYGDQWGLDGGDIAIFGDTYAENPLAGAAGATYLQYKQIVIGNPDLHWEKSKKQNIGIDYAFFNNTISGTLDVFQDDRTDVFMSADQRSSYIPGYFGAAPVAANVGKVQNKGFEFDIKLQHTWSGVHCWVDYNFAHSVDKVVYAGEGELIPKYQKGQDFQIGQPKVFVEQPGFTKSWDDLYGSVGYETNSGRLPGDLAMIDYNADGIINNNDRIAYGYPNRPQNTYNTSLGVDYKNFSFSLHFFGVYNVSQNFTSIIYMSDPRSPMVNSFLNDYWTPSNPDAEYALSRAGGSGTGRTSATRGIMLDGSYLRLKNVELSYTFTGKWVKNLNLSSLRLNVNGNNLLFWSKIPEDKEAAIDIWQLNSNANGYPTVKRINLGLNATF